MTITIGQPERVTQNCVIALFRDELGYALSATGLTNPATVTSSKGCSRPACCKVAVHFDLIKPGQSTYPSPDLKIVS